jgi:indole-3-glycerol phosphate synthase/phosphoribosylanthranilate isomerase
MDFLSEILEVKRQRVAAAKARQPLGDVRELAHAVRQRTGSHALVHALNDSSRPNIIAEFKRRSPSKGKINESAEPETVARMYESGGAAAISVLTEEDYFEGSLHDLHKVRQAASLPVLRKDFILDDYQAYESAAAGADALLLIVAALDDETLTRLRTIAEDELGLDALVEVHTKPELDRAIKCGARLIGVNNRNLRTFEVSTETSVLLARAAPRDAILVSESGLTPDEVRRLRALGYRGFLVGETLMRAADPTQAVRDFIGKPEPLASRTPFIKICGITNIDDARAAIDAGADMLGFNFYRRSPRFIEPNAARTVIDALRSNRPSNASVKSVGVFVNDAVKDVVELATGNGLDGVQLHGDEGVEFCANLKNGTFKPFVIKVVRSGHDMDFAKLEQYAVDAFMVDTYDPKLRGGTGRTADWTLAREAAKKLPRVFLAGGLSPANVGDAIAAVRPYAVDACSSLEISPGKKDHARLREFVAAVRASKLHAEAEAAK